MWHLVIGLRSVTKLVLPLISAAMLICLSEEASAQIFNQVIVFGDSNVDAGYYKLLSNPSGNATYNSLWPSAVAAGAGAPTTNPGLVKSQVLAALFGLTANPANTPGGTNYATSGAKNVTINNAQTGGFTAAIPTVTQISNYLNANAGKANSQALYLVYSGSNDVSYATGGTGNGPYPANPQAYVTQAANQLATAIASLSAAGAKTIIVADLDYSFGATNVMQLRLLYTQTLWNQLTTLGVPFLKGDANAARLAIVANPAKYGFTFVDNNTGHVACTEPTGITTAWALLCSSNPAAPSTLTSPNAAQTDLFADDQHFATSGQSLLGNYFYRLIVPYTATHDLNGDGKSDLLWLDTSGNIGLWLMNGASTLSTSVIGNVSGMWSVVGQRDFNDDGKSDILWRDTAGDVAMWLMNGPSVQTSAMIGNVPTNWSVAGTGDFNGDGYGDILWRDTTGNVGLWLMKGTSVQQAVVVGNVPVTWVVVGADLYGNIFWRNSATGEVGMWVMAGTAIAQSVDFGVVPLTWTVAGIGDFDGNGSTDILWRDASGNVGIWLMNGTQVMSTAVLGNVPLNWTIVQTGDYNGDGKSDILWTDNGGDVGMWLMNGAGVSSTAILGNVGPNWTVQSLNAD